MKGKIKIVKIALTLILISSTYSWSQQLNDEIQSIRKRYNRINSSNVELVKITYNNSDYYLEQGKISKVVSQNSKGRFEYYFDTKQSAYYPYFIYFESNDKSANTDIRAYYTDLPELIQLKLNDELVELNPQTNRYHYLELQAYNNLNQLLNLFEVASYQDDTRANETINQAKALRQRITQLDTIKVEDNEGSYELKLVHKDAKGNVIKETEVYSVEHHGSTSYTYYNNSNMLLRIESGETWVGDMSYEYIGLSYFSKGKVYRTDTYNSYGFDVSDSVGPENELDFSSTQMIPLIKYYDSKL